MDFEIHDQREVRVNEPEARRAARRKLFMGELSATEYAATLVTRSGSRILAPEYRSRPRFGRSGRTRFSSPLRRAALLLTLSALGGLTSAFLIVEGVPSFAAVLPALLGGTTLLLTLLVVGRSTAIQEIWYLTGEKRKLRSHIDAYAAYAGCLDEVLQVVLKRRQVGELSPELVQNVLGRMRMAMVSTGHQNAAVAILRRERERYFLAYCVLPANEPDDRFSQYMGVEAADMFRQLSKDSWTQSVAFRFAGNDHELLAVSDYELRDCERWALSQLAIYLSDTDALMASEGESRSK